MNKIKNCFLCDEELFNTKILCCECYKINLNSLYKQIKMKCPDIITFQDLKSIIRNEKYENKCINLKNENNKIVIEYKKHIVEY